MWCLCLNLTRAEAQRCDKTEKNRQHKETFGCNLSVVLLKSTFLTFILVFPSVAPYSRCPFIRVRIKYSPRSWCKCFEEFPFLCFKGFSCVRQVKWKLRSLFSPLTACKRNTVLPYTSQWELSNSPVRLWSDNSHCPKSLSLQHSLLQVYGLCGRSFVIKIALTSPAFSFLVLPILSFRHFSRLTFSLLPFTPRLSSSRLSASSSTRLCCESQWDLALCQVMCYQPRHRLTQTQTQTHTNKQTHTCTYICTRNLMQECDGKRSLARSSY